MKEIGDNEYSTDSPIPFRVVVDESLGYKLSLDLRVSGVFSYRVTDPMLFYTNVCGNISESYYRSEIDSRLRGELLNALQPALAEIAARRIMYDEIPAHTPEISESLNKVLSSLWKEKRSLEVFSFSVSSLSIPDEQRKKITEWEENAMTMNPLTAASRLVGAQADAMRTAAGNAGGAAVGFMGLNMAGGYGGINAQELYAMSAQRQQKKHFYDGTDIFGKVCPKCGATTSQNGPCHVCGYDLATPATSSYIAGEPAWKCSCGRNVQGKFCPDCGAKKTNPIRGSVHAERKRYEDPASTAKRKNTVIPPPT